MPISTFDDGLWGRASSATDTVTSNFLISGQSPEGTKSETFSGPVAVAVGPYAVVGRVTASGKVVLSVKSATDGSQNPIGVTVHALPVSAGDVPVNIFYNGTFNPDALVWDASWATDADKKLAFEKANPQITIKKITG